MATAKKAKVTATVETKKAAPRRKPAAAAAKKSATAAAPKARKAKPAAELMPEEIERLAYRLWEERGRPGGTSTEDWNRAQEILLQAR